MLSQNKKAKFFCENCGSEVPENAKLCKKCGKFFISVRCPNCGKSGTSKEFKKGCPGCGYAMGKPGFAGASTLDKAAALNALLSGASASARRNAGSHKNDHSLPVWIYAFTFALLVGVMVGVYSCIKSPLY